MNRREARVRKEYLYRKSLEEKDKRLQDSKKAIADSISNSVNVPSSLKGDAVSLAQKAIMDEHIEGIFLF